MAVLLAGELGDRRPQIDACVRSRRPAGGGGDETAALFRTLERSGLSRTDQALLRRVQAAARASTPAAPRTILLEVETGDREVRIVDVPSVGDGSVFLACARQELSGRRLPLPAGPAGAAGQRLSVALPVR
jgi:hypothetical protein